MKTLHTIVEEAKLHTRAIAFCVDYSYAEKEDELDKHIESIASRLLSSFEELVPKNGSAPIKLMQDGVSMDFSFREGYNACRTELMARIAAFKEGKV